MPDYSLANAPWIGATLPQLVAKRQQENDAHQRLLDEQSQRQFENNRQTTSDTANAAQLDLENRIRAQKAADQFTWNQNWAAGVDAIGKQYKPGTPDHDAALRNLFVRMPPPSGFTGGEVSALARPTPQADYGPAPTAPAPVTIPPQLSIPDAGPIVLPGGPGALPVPPMPPQGAPATPVVSPARATANPSMIP